MKRSLACLSRSFFVVKTSKTLPLTRYLSTQEDIERRNHLFTLEKKRQLENVGRIEKIEVNYKGIPQDCTLVMNKDISTPHDCARHLSEWHAESSALALIDGKVPWDMHRPLPESCTLEFLNYTAADPHHVNKAFWRTCSVVLGACASVAFKDRVSVKLHSFPSPDIRRGSFIYDIDLSLADWRPTEQELRTLSAEYVRLCRAALAVERLQAGAALAAEMFAGNEHKSRQIPSVAANNDGKVTLYRIGKHVDISKGPLISNSAQIGRVAVTAVHKLTGGADSEVKQLYRFQGVALPTGIIIDHFAFSILLERAKKFNKARSPFSTYGVTETAPESIAAIA